MIPLSPLTIKLILAAVVLSALGAFLGWVHHTGVESGKATVQAAWDRANQVAVAARQVRIEQVRGQELQLRKEKEKDDVEQARRFAALNADVAALRGELRNRPARGTAPGFADLRPGGPAVGPALRATGADLYRDDADFLVGFASDAVAIREQRDSCYAQYERLRAAIAR